jgi:hypothetical protein
MWAPIALEPVAAMRDASLQGQDPLAKRILSIAEDVRRSSLGGAASQTNPIAGSEVFQLARDFAAISSNDAALAHFIESPAMQRLREEPKLKRVLAEMEQDPEVARLKESSGAISPEVIQTLMNSDALMRAIDATDIKKLLLPAAGEIRAALREARERAEGPAPRTRR